MVYWKKICMQIILLMVCCLATSTPVFSSDDIKIKFAGSVANILDKPSKFYSGKEALRIAETFLLYQRSNGGWPKNYDSIRVLSDKDKKELVRTIYSLFVLLIIHTGRYSLDKKILG